MMVIRAGQVAGFDFDNGILGTECAVQVRPKAVGGNPREMTAEGHRSAAETEKALSDWNRDQASKNIESKAITQFELRRPSLLKVERHEDF
jgi:hypothetical protein